MNDKTNTKTKPAIDDPMAALAAELEACRKAVDFCFTLAMGQEEVEETWPRAPWNKLGDLNDRFHVMSMAIRLMAASGALAESIAKAKSGGELRQSITVERLERFADAGGEGADTRPKNIRQDKGAVPALVGQGEGGGGEK